MNSAQDYIEQNKKILDDPMISSQSRRHTEEELISLEKWVETHPEDNHDLIGLKLYCNDNLDVFGCRVHEEQ